MTGHPVLHEAPSLTDFLVLGNLQLKEEALAIDSIFYILYALAYIIFQFEKKTIRPQKPILYNAVLTHTTCL